MKAYEISREEIKGLEPICEGYKAVNYDLSTRGDKDFRYGKKGENIIGKVFHVEGELKACNLGLHFSKDPANVFRYYKSLGYNRYFKVKAYGNCIDGDNGCKTVASTIEFVEEYDIVEFIEIIKKYFRSAVNDSNAVSLSNAVNHSNAVSLSNAVNYSYGLRNCKGAYNSIFCVNKNGICNYLFNKRSNKKRIDEVKVQLLNFYFAPHFANWYDVKGQKEWYAFCFPELKSIDNKTAWSKMPQEMLDYIKSLPEYDEEVFNKIVGD